MQNVCWVLSFQGAAKRLQVWDCALLLWDGTVKVQEMVVFRSGDFGSD